MPTVDGGLLLCSLAGGQERLQLMQHILAHLVTHNYQHPSMTHKTYFRNGLRPITVLFLIMGCLSYTWAGSNGPSFKVSDSKRTVGQKVYENNNHLNSVAVTFSDKKQAAHTGTSLQQPMATVLSWQEQYAYGGGVHGRAESSPSYRYGYQGSEKDDETAGDGNHYTTHYRQLDPRVGRWMSIDPKSTPWESPYVSMGDNPFRYTDALGDTVRGVNKKSGTRAVNAMHEGFAGASGSKIRGLIKLNADGTTLSPISEDDFVDAVATLTPDQQSLAYGYYNVINSAETHTVEAVKLGEAFSAEAQAMLAGSGIATPADLLTLGGGGANAQLPGQSGSTTIMVCGLGAYATGINVDGAGECAITAKSDGETLSHELVGHGQGHVAGTPDWQHAEAVQMSNLQRRARGIYEYRDASGHGTRVILSRKEATATPPQSTMPRALLERVTLLGAQRRIQEWNKKNPQYLEPMDLDRFDPVRVKRY